MRGLDVDDGIEGAIREWQVFRIALDEFEIGERVTFFAKRDAGRVEIEAGIMGRSHGAGQVGRAAAMAATDFQDILATEIRLGGDVVIELDAGTVHLIPGREGNTHRRLGFVGIVEENDAFFVQAAGEKGIPEFPNRFADRLVS